MDFVWADPVSYEQPAPLCQFCGQTEVHENLQNGITRRSCACSTMTICPPPHFPQPDADPIAVLEAALSEKDEMIAGLYAEAKAWQSQLEAALKRISELEAR